VDLAELLWSGADAQARALRAGQVGAVELVEAVLDRLAAVEPRINAFRVTFPTLARAEALAAQRRLDAGEEAPLLGVPVAVKDDTDVAGVPTGYGTDPNQRTPAKADSELVFRLRAAGAVIVGKTHVPELTIWPFTETLHHGSTRNPWALDRTPGGSSGGSAAAVAAGVVGVAHGSDGAGSIRIPSAWCGLVGLKPTRDLVPTAPLANDWYRLSHFGPIARDVASAARFLDACTGHGGFLAGLSQPLTPQRVAVSRHSPPGTVPALRRAQRAALERTVALLRELGHSVVELDPDVPPQATGFVLARYLRGVHDSVAAVPPGSRLEPRTRGMGRLGGLVPRSAVRASLRGEPALARRVLGIFDEVDVVLQPGPSAPPSRIGAYARHGAARTLAAAIAKVPFLPLWNLIGNPVLAAPMHTDEAGRPVGVQLVGPPGADRNLLRLALDLEAATGWATRRPPLFSGE
jgi:amidase